MSTDTPPKPPYWSREIILSMLPEAIRIWLSESLRFSVRVGLVVASIAGSAYALGRLRSVLATLLVSAVFAYIMRPMAAWLCRRKGMRDVHDAIASVFSGMAAAVKACLVYPIVRLVRRGWTPPARPAGPVRVSAYTHRVLATFYVLVLVFVAGYYSVRWTVNPFVQEIKQVADNWGTRNDADLRLKATQGAKDFTDWYEAHVSQDVRDQIDAQLKQQQADDTLPRRVATWASGLVGQLGPISRYIVEIVLFPVLAFYFALDSRKIKHEFVGTLSRRRRREAMRIIHEFNGIMYSFVVGQAILCAIAGVVVGVGLAALGVKYSLTLGLLAGFTRAIPIVGPIIGGIPIIALVLATKGLGVALAVLGFFTFLHFAESKFLMPYLIGDRMNLHPVVVIVVLLIGEEFGGLLGMFFAPPVAALIRVLVRRYWLRAPREFGGHGHGH